jgi:hypothetical protein
MKPRVSSECRALQALVWPCANVERSFVIRTTRRTPFLAPASGATAFCGWFFRSASSSKGAARLQLSAFGMAPELSTVSLAKGSTGESHAAPSS